MRKAAENNGYMALKVELIQAKITRRIVIPEHMTHKDLNDALQVVMGLYDAYLWQFTDKRRDGVIYELPHENDSFPSFSKRLTADASMMPLCNVLPGRGAKLKLIQRCQDAIPKIGHNAPCPCKLDKKFKNYCEDYSHKAS